MVTSPRHLLAATALWLAGCSAISGLDEFRLSRTPPAADGGAVECSTHADCKGRQRDGFAAEFCSRLDHRCVALQSAECGKVSGPAGDDSAVLIGSLFATTGAQGMVNAAREQSVLLAVDEVNGAGGLPPAAGGGKPRPLVLVACDASEAPQRAAEHLVKDLHVPAIVGPNNSQNTLDLAQAVTIPGGTLTLSPTAVAASIAELRDDDLVWQMVPHDAQRGPLLIYEIGETERALRALRGGGALKLAVIVRDDALGDGTRASLTELNWNGERLARAVSAGVNARIDTYATSDGEQSELVRRYLDYAPDVVVLVGAGEAISGIMAPLERGWRQGPRPEYLVIDSSRVPELLALAEEIPGLSGRVRGTGITPSAQALPVDEAFQLAYVARYPDSDQATSSGVGPSYDATYAIAYGLAAAQGGTTGRDVARGLRRLSMGEELPVGPAQLLAAFRHLAQGEAIDATGTYSKLAWDDRGALSAGTLEIWCLQDKDGTVSFTSSGLTADIPTQVLHGENARCTVGRGDAQIATGVSPLPATPVAGSPAPQAPPPPSAAGAGGMAGRVAGMSGAAGAAGQRAPVLRPPAQPVPCGGALQCRRSAGEYCCVSQLRIVASSNDFSCETAPRSCAATVRCSSDRECENGAICCLTGQRESYCSAAGSCAATEHHLACDKPADCGSGGRCCSHSNDPTALTGTSCATSCDTVVQGSQALCSRNADCTSLNGCQYKPFLGSVGLCL